MSPAVSQTENTQMLVQWSGEEEVLKAPRAEEEENSGLLCEACEANNEAVFGAILRSNPFLICLPSFTCHIAAAKRGHVRIVQMILSTAQAVAAFSASSASSSSSSSSSFFVAHSQFNAVRHIETQAFTAATNNGRLDIMAMILEQHHQHPQHHQHHQEQQLSPPHGLVYFLRRTVLYECILQLVHQLVWGRSEVMAMECLAQSPIHAILLSLVFLTQHHLCLALVPLRSDVWSFLSFATGKARSQIEEAAGAAQQQQGSHEDKTVVSSNASAILSALHAVGIIFSHAKSICKEEAESLCVDAEEDTTTSECCEQEEGDGVCGCGCVELAAAVEAEYHHLFAAS